MSRGYFGIGIVNGKFDAMVEIFFVMSANAPVHSKFALCPRCRKSKTCPIMGREALACWDNRNLRNSSFIDERVK